MATPSLPRSGNFGPVLRGEAKVKAKVEAEVRADFGADRVREKKIRWNDICPTFFAVIASRVMLEGGIGSHLEKIWR